MPTPCCSWWAPGSLSWRSWQGTAHDYRRHPRARGQGQGDVPRGGRASARRLPFRARRKVAARAGYQPDRIAELPPEAVESFAGVGYFFDLAALEPGEIVVDLGSGSGMDALYAGGLVGPTGQVIGVDFTLAQLAKARKLAANHGAAWVDFRESRIEELPLAD